MGTLELDQMQTQLGMSSNMKRSRIRDYGIVVGTLPTGQHNAITDVPGVQVGHLTLIKGNHGERCSVVIALDFCLTD
jgi:hypothetical protein